MTRRRCGGRTLPTAYGPEERGPWLAAQPPVENATRVRRSVKTGAGPDDEAKPLTP